ncbi:sigma 54-interacting transcriptional regulator [Dyadobacter sp. 3J3]|uniref:sigma-54-dependent Fis family transcriptional regulator n=1 Tax=Dyadobacter sp. 3J3 TaxID=2606600 RepID=UPI001E5AAD4F|nr:sigma 54-interacting transcriptional regulator [Dyadobacter sp. 3J3]
METATLPHNIQIEKKTKLVKLIDGDNIRSIIGISGKEQSGSSLQNAIGNHLKSLIHLHDQLQQITENHFPAEAEQTKLISLSNEIAATTNKTELLDIVTTKLKELFSISGFVIMLYGQDGKTHTPHILYLNDAVISHEDFKQVLYRKNSVEDIVFDRTIHSNGTVIFNIAELGELCDVSFWIQNGLTHFAGVPLRVGEKNLGCLFFYMDIDSLNKVSDMLLRGVCAQISVAISNVLANEEIVRRESERELLFSLNSDIATIRNSEDLLSTIKRKIKGLLGCTHTTIIMINDDKVTASTFLLDPDSRAKNHPLYQKAVGEKTFINDDVFGRVISEPLPVIFDMQELVEKQELLPYFAVNYESGISQIVIAKFSKLGETFGFWMIHFDEKQNANKLSLINSLANQISIAVSNITANEEIWRREEEKSSLLAFSNAIASVRDKCTLAQILKQQLKKLFKIDYYVIHTWCEDRETYWPMLFDPENEFLAHSDFEKIKNHNLSSYDDTILAAKDERLLSTWLRIGEESIAVMDFRHSGKNERFQENLFTGICSQIAIAVANIISSEKISKQICEINNYKQQLEEEKIYLKEEIEITQNYGEIIGESPAIQRTFRLVAQVASSDSTVLLLGETGTGKELIARAIHNNSPRKNKLMVKVNCAALPPNLIESELFGHERGSFTGATERRLGKFELANNGTLFLDEIGEMPLDLQVKLLRALQEKEIERVGGKNTIKVDVRIIAATNRDLEKEMEEGRFRSDLYYRLNIFPINLPALRDRREDIPLLATHFISRYSKKTGRRISTISNKVLQDLVQYCWPGNIRELEHLIERSVLLSTGNALNNIVLPTLKKQNKMQAQYEDVQIKTIDENEREHILKILKTCSGRVSGDGGAAILLGVPVSTLNSKIKRLGIRKEHFA